MNRNNLVFLDYETGSADCHTTFPVEIAAKAFNGITLEPFPNGEFESLCKPEDMSLVTDEALEINKIKREDIEKAPDLSVVWKQFVSFVERFNPKRNKWEAPIPAGHNITGFDLIITDRMNKLYGPKKEKTILFNTFHKLDLLQPCFWWFENSNELPNFKLDTLRSYFGISKEGSHRAMQDVLDSSNIILRFLKLHRRLMKSGNIKFKNSMSN